MHTATRKRLTAALGALLAAGCAAVPPERAEREAAIMRAVEPCEQQYPRFRVTGFNLEGRAHFEYPASATLTDREGFRRCINEAIQRVAPRKKPPPSRGPLTS